MTIRRQATLGRAALSVLFAAAACLLPIATARADDGPGDPTGPITLPVTGMVLDPLAPATADQIETKSQPNASQLPFFDANLGWFGQGFARPTPGSPTVRRVALTTGHDATTDRDVVYVAAGGSNNVQMFDAQNLTALGSFGPAGTGQGGLWLSIQSIAYYKEEVFVLGTASGDGGQRIRVFDAQGHLKRVLPPLGRLGPASGIDAGFGELWLSSPPAANPDQTGQQVIVLDALTGAIKGLSRQPLDDVAGPAGVSWWDISVVPELEGAIVDRRLFKRGELIPGIPTPDSPLCTAGAYDQCSATNQVGTDAPWGMHWFLELEANAADATYRPVKEYSIDDRSLVIDSTLTNQIFGGPLEIGLPGYYLTLKRTWRPKQDDLGDAKSLSDVAYLNRDARIDWYGLLKGSTWLRGKKCLNYVVSKGDIFVVGDKGERWYELVDNLDHIGLSVDGQPVPGQSGTTPTGQFCINDTHTLSNGTHSIALDADLTDGRHLHVENPDVHVDNEPPSGSLAAVGQYARATVQLSGTAQDAHSGVRDWIVQVLPPGADPQSGWKDACSSSALAAATNAATCTWSTAASSGGQSVFPDGTYQVRVRVRDNSSDDGTADPLNGTPQTSDDGNAYFTPTQTTLVDNTPPELTDPAPAVGTPYSEEFTQPVESALLSQTDSGSGMASTSLEYNTATDGSASGGWVPAQAAPIQGNSQQLTSWNTSEVPDGLHRVRATGTDRAGNSQQIEYQAVFAERRRGCPAKLISGVHRCHGGVSLFRQDAKPADGVRATLQLPGFVPKGDGFTVNTFFLGGGGLRSVEGGAKVRGCPDRADNQDEHWHTFAQYQAPIGHAEASPCFSQLAKTWSGNVTSVLSANGYAQVSIGGRVRAIVDRQKHYDIGVRGDSYIAAAYGETNHWGRRIAGDFLGVDYLGADGGWHPASSGLTSSQDDGYGYGHNGTPDRFCVYGPSGGCPAP